MKQIVIAPYLAHPKLFNDYRKEDPFCDVKFFTKEEFLSNFKYQFTSDAVIYLISNYKIYSDIALQYLRLISELKVDSSNNEQISFLIKLKNELISKGLIYKNDLFTKELENAKIEIFYYAKDDPELIGYLSGLNYQFNENKGLYRKALLTFSSSEDELFFVFNEISRLISKGKDPNKIAIYGINDEDELLLERMQKNFRINLNGVKRKNILTKTFVNKFLINLKEMNVNDALDSIKNYENDEYFESFKHIVLDNQIDVPMNFQIDLYRYLFKSLRIPTDKFEKAVEVVNEPICPNNGYLFIINFCQGLYPSVVKNNDLLSDDLKKQVGITTTEASNTALYNYYKECLKQKGTLYVSCANKNSSVKLLTSSLAKTLEMEKFNDIFHYDVYSPEEAEIQLTNLRDLKRNYLYNSKKLKSYNDVIDIPYMEYDNSYNGVNRKQKYNVVELSYTKTKEYYECKFKYFLNRELKIDDNESNFNSVLGNTMHNILEKIPSGKSFDELFEAEYAHQVAKGEISEDDAVFYVRLKEDLRKAFNFILSFEAQVKNPKYLREQKYEFSLEDKIILEGRLDKVIMFGENQEHIAVVDYKTGHEEFSENLIDYGLSIQLPTYSAIVQHEYPEKKIAGLFIERVLNKSAIVSKVTDDPKYFDTFKLAGTFIDNTKTVEMLDKTIADNAKYVASAKLNKDGTFGEKSSRYRNSDWFVEKSNKAIELIKDAGHHILNNDFKIDPKVVDGTNKSCTYCNYRDICFRNIKNYIYINTKKKD